MRHHNQVRYVLSSVAILAVIAAAPAAGSDSEEMPQDQDSRPSERPPEGPTTQVEAQEPAQKPGTHVMVFEIRTTEMELNRLREDKKDLEAKLDKAVSNENQAEQGRLRLLIKSVDTEIERREAAGPEPADLAERMVAIIKRRIARDERRGIVWRAIPPNRFEVRMPGASRETRAAKEAYEREVAVLKEGNLDDMKIRRLLQAESAEQEPMFASLAQNDPSQMELLRELVASHGVMKKAEERLEEANSKLKDAIRTFDAVKGSAGEAGARKKAAEADKHVKEASEALRRATWRHEEVRHKALIRGAINLEYLRTEVLSYYVSPREAAAARKEGREKEIRRKQELFNQRAGELLAEHPARRAQLEGAIDAYKTWSDLRRYFDDPDDLKRLIARGGVLEFRIVPYLPIRGYEFVVTEIEWSVYVKMLKMEGPESVRKRDGKYIWMPLHGKQEENVYEALPVVKHADGKDYMLVYNEEGFMMLHEPPPTGWRIIRARPTVDGMGRPAAMFEFDAKGARMFGALTEAHEAKVDKPGHTLAIVLDDEVYSAPVVMQKISSRGIITGTFSRQEVTELARTLEAGVLPAQVNPVPISETFIPATEGKSGDQE